MNYITATIPFVQITHTVSALNIMYLPEFHDFFEQHYPNFKIWNNAVHYPKWICASVLSQVLKKIITDKLLRHEWLPNTKVRYKH